MGQTKNIIACMLTVSMTMLTSCATIQSGGPVGGCGMWSSPTTCILAHTAGGAIIGGAVGAGTAKATGGNVGKGAAIGGGAGAIMAFAWAWGKCFACFTKVKSEQLDGYDSTKNRTGYKPNQGTEVKIDKATLNPSAVSPGDKIVFQGNYHVMFPTDRSEMSVTETAILKVYDEKGKKFVEVGQSPETVIVAAGSRKADSEIPIPDNAEEGKFLIVFMITADGKSDSVEMPFMVTKNKEILARAKVENARGMTAQQVRQGKELGSSGGKAVKTEKQVLIIANKANLRESPSTEGKIVGSATKNEKYPYVSTKDVAGKKWHEVRISGTSSAWLIATAGTIVEK